MPTHASTLEHIFDTEIELDVPKRDNGSCSVDEQNEKLHEGLENEGYVPFHGKKEPRIEIKTEKAIHRYMAYLVATGKSQLHIAEETGYSKHSVSEICRQKWFLRMVAHLMQEAGADPLKKLFEGAAVDSFHTMIEMRDAKDTPPTVKASICVNLLDRYMGKPTSHVITEKKNSSEDPKREAESLREELAKLEQQRTEMVASQTSRT